MSEKAYIVQHDLEDTVYSRLEKEALECLQLLSGKIWTDFNAHDPGVTIVEILHYALIELQYLMELPFESYFTKAGIVDYEAMGLYTLPHLQLPSIVTLEDYETLIKKHIKAVSICKISLLETNKYSIKLTIDAKQDPKQIEQKVNKLYHAHRNLGENLEEIIIECKELHQGMSQPSFREIENATGKELLITNFYSEYYSIQNHFPDCYGVNEKGISGRTTEQSKAQMMQLKAYLLIFDSLLANFHHHLNTIFDLFNLSNKDIQPFALNFELNDLDKLVDSQRFSSTIFTNNKHIHTQKSKLLDMLKILYGENDNFLSLQTSIDKNAEYIKQLPQLRADRFKAFNILDYKSTAGIRKILFALWGYKANTEDSLSEVLQLYNLFLMSDEMFFYKYKSLNVESLMAYSESIVENYKIDKVPVIDIEYTDTSFPLLENNLSFLWHGALFDSLIRYGHQAQYYRILRNPIRKLLLLVFKAPGMHTWMDLGFFVDNNTLVYIANLFWKFIASLHPKLHRFYVIEHILLEDEENFNTITFVVPKGSEWEQEPAFESFLYEQVPAHLYIQLCWMETEQLANFELSYRDWRKALSKGDKERIQHTALKIREEINESLLK